MLKLSSFVDKWTKYLFLFVWVYITKARGMDIFKDFLILLKSIKVICFKPFLIHKGTRLM